MNDKATLGSKQISIILEPAMKRLTILFGLAVVLLSGCIVPPYGGRDGGYRDRGDWHDHRDDRDGDRRRDDGPPNRY